MRWRGISLKQLGLWKKAPARGWIVAAVATILFLVLNLSGPLRGPTHLTELSLFHFGNSLVAGLGAGFCEETFFRGYLMSCLAQARFSTLMQIVISALLFGIMHSGWAFGARGFSLLVLLAAVIQTAVLGAIYGFHLPAKAIEA